MTDRIIIYSDDKAGGVLYGDSLASFLAADFDVVDLSHLIITMAEANTASLLALATAWIDTTPGNRTFLFIETGHDELADNTQTPAQIAASRQTLSASWKAALSAAGALGNVIQGTLYASYEVNEQGRRLVNSLIISAAKGEGDLIADIGGDPALDPPGGWRDSTATAQGYPWTANNGYLDATQRNPLVGTYHPGLYRRVSGMHRAAWIIRRAVLNAAPPIDDLVNAKRDAAMNGRLTLFAGGGVTPLVTWPSLNFNSSARGMANAGLTTTVNLSEVPVSPVAQASATGTADTAILYASDGTTVIETMTVGGVFSSAQCRMLSPVIVSGRHYNAASLLLG